VSDALVQWNLLGREEATAEALSCCGSREWAEAMVAKRPFADLAEVLQEAGEIWWNLSDADWLEAFRAHPRIGESRGAGVPSEKSLAWSSEEQRQVAESEEAVKTALAEANRSYEERFGRTFIVCATGKSPGEILQILRLRLQNDAAAELREAADEQLQITEIRLRKWLRE
jgi:2-oxo-4-hydroxy-4-carboxy-5-ureidoimidazoline decarboxylase